MSFISIGGNISINADEIEAIQTKEDGTARIFMTHFAFDSKFPASAIFEMIELNSVRKQEREDSANTELTTNMNDYFKNAGTFAG